MEHTESFRSEIRAADRERWERRGRALTERLDIPEPLRDAIRATLETPQCGPYHNEGLYLASHLGCIDEAAEQIADGTFDYSQIGLSLEQTALVRELLERTVRTHRREVDEYITLHDLKKRDCMNVELADGSQRVFPVEEWEVIVTDAHGDSEQIRDRFRELGIAKIGYRQSAEITGGEERDHGPEGVRYLEELGRAHWDVAVYCAERSLILAGVANHEMHFQVFPASAAAKHYAEKIAKRFSEEEAEFILTVCFLDIAGSKAPDGSSEYDGFRNMLMARESYHMVEEFRRTREKTGRPLRENELSHVLNLENREAVHAAIVHLEQPPELFALTPEQLVAVEAKLAEWMRNFRIAAEREPDIHAALRSDQYAEALQAFRLGALVGAIRKYIKQLGT